MNARQSYSKQVSCINKIARHFAMKNFHVTITFYSQDGGCEATIFFHNLQLKEIIERDLCKYVDSDDTVVFDVFDSCNPKQKFYIYKIQKHPS